VDVTGLLLRVGATRPHVMIAAMPGATDVRLTAEEQLRRRGWPAALTPADADVLVVAGTAAPDIAQAVEAAWAAVPAPRVRVRATRPDDVAPALDAARVELASAADQRRSAATHRPGSHGGHDPGSHGGHDPGSHEAMSGDHHGHDAASAGHHGHDMGGMAMPAGLPMASRAEDRDGLKLDQLHVALGPFLPDWPAGLVARLILQGDVVQHAEADAVGLMADAASFWAEPWRRASAGEPVTTGTAARRRAAAHLDSLARFLGVAGWADAATAARALRDDTLRGTPASRLGPAVRRFAARVARSRLLAWSTRGMGTLRPDDPAAAWANGQAPLLAVDVTARYRRWCADLADLAVLLDDDSLLDSSVLAPPRGQGGAGQAPSAALLAVLPRLLEGAEFAAARLIVASLDPDLDELPATAGAGHGR
jgi:hypothetical protein